MHSIYNNQLLKEYFLKYEGSEEDYKEVGSGYLLYLSKTLSFAGYKVSFAVKALGDTLNLLKQNEKKQLYIAAIGKSKYHK